LLVLAAFLAGTVGVAAVANASEHGVPFHARISLVAQSYTGPIAQCGSLPNVGYTGTYTGTAAALGQVTDSSTVCLNFADLAYPNLPYTVYETFQAANGDLLSDVASGNYNLATGTGTDGHFTITGGTGRFLHAHGSGTDNLIVDASGNVVGVTYAGTLFYDASDRSG
jgi:hypothetical protein